MRLTKKKVLVSAIAVCLIAILSLGTLAWFNATDKVTNEFKIADSDGDGSPDFSVDVWENDPTGTDPTAKDQDGVTYEHIAPGDVLPKNPTVENTGDYDQWIRVYVTFDEYPIIKKACEAQGITTDLRSWLNVYESAWIKADEEYKEEGDTVTYVYYYKYKLTADDSANTAVLFTEVSIPGEFEMNDMKYYGDNFCITVKAEALQADNTGDNAKDAFATYWGK